MDYIKAFVTGGLLCAAVQILMDKTKLMPGRIMVLLVVCGSILGAIGLYEPYAKWAGSGATVPLLGFGNTLWKGVRDGIDKDGVLGLFTGGFILCRLCAHQRLCGHDRWRQAVHRDCRELRAA